MQDVNSEPNLHLRMNAAGFNLSPDQQYSVKFKLFYETVPGEDLYVIGDIPYTHVDGTQDS